VKNKITEIISFSLVIITLVVMLICSFSVSYNKFNLRDYSFILIGIGIIALINYIITKIKNLKFNKYEIFIFILILFALLSLINAIDIETALFGLPNRNEGLFVILTYYLLFLNSLNIKKVKYIKIIIYSILFIGLINVIYGLFQVSIIETNLDIVGKWHYTKGLLGNSMYFGTLMCITTPICLGGFIKTDDKKTKILNLILLIIFLFGSFLSGAMATFVSLIVIFLLVIFDTILVFKRNKTKGEFQVIYLILCIVLFGTLLLIENVRNNSLNSDVNELFSQVTDVASGKIESNFGTGRIYIWKNTIEKIKDNSLTGVGIDNFKYAFDPYLIDLISNTVVTKAHNDYLQKMLCEGIFSGITFIAFLLYIFFKNIRNYKNYYHYGLFLAFTCYSVQAFFSISVTRVAPIYFILMGLVVSMLLNNSNLDGKSKK